MVSDFIAGAIIYMAGLFTGIFVMWFGLRLGFKASYELRGDVDGTGKGLFGRKEDPPEFNLTGDESEDELREIENGANVN